MPFKQCFLNAQCPTWAVPQELFSSIPLHLSQPSHAFPPLDPASHLHPFSPNTEKEPPEPWREKASPQAWASSASCLHLQIGPCLHENRSSQTWRRALTATPHQAGLPPFTSSSHLLSLALPLLTMFENCRKNFFGQFSLLFQAVLLLPLFSNLQISKAFANIS